MSKRILAVDDEREHKNATVLCRTVAAGISALEKLGPWDELILDHDMAEFTETDLGVAEATGYKIVCYLEMASHLGNKHLIPDTVTLCTSNPAALKRMGSALDGFMTKKGSRTWTKR